MSRPYVVGVVVLAFLVAFSCVGMAAGTAKSLSARRISGITIDAYIDEAGWEDMDWQEVKKENSYLEGGRWDSNDQFSGKFAIGYDDEYIYAAFIMKDTATFNMGDEVSWEGDCVEMWFQWASSTAFNSEQFPHEAYYQINFTPVSLLTEPAKPGDETRPTKKAWRTWDVDPVTNACEVASRVTEEGWILEIRIKYGVMNGADPRPDSILFNVSFSDSDGPLDRVRRITWSGRVHKMPIGWATLTFE